MNQPEEAEKENDAAHVLLDVKNSHIDRRVSSRIKQQKHFDDDDDSDSALDDPFNNCPKKKKGKASKKSSSKPSSKQSKPSSKSSGKKMPDKPPRKSETEARHVQNHVDNLENDLQESKSHILELQEANSSFNTSFNNLKEKHRKAIKSHAVQAVKSAADALMIKGLRNEIEKMKKASKDDRDKHKSEIKDMKVLHKVSKSSTTKHKLALRSRLILRMHVRLS